MERTASNLAWIGSITTAGLLSLGLAGCGGSNEPGASNEQVVEAPRISSKGGIKIDKPADAVRMFLQAVKSGDKKIVESMLTPLALKKTSESGKEVAPPGTPTASFEVGEFEIEKDLAQVFSTWTDVTETGEKQTEKMIWMLRNEGALGWRISGMAMTIFEGGRPLFLNFEDPDDMDHQTKLVEQEIIRRSQQAAKAQTKTPPQESGAQQKPVKQAQQPTTDLTK